MLEMQEKKDKTKEAKSQLHKIEGFYPETELMEITVYDEYGNEAGKKYYLPLNVKETWFWLVYPEGKIENKIVHSSETSVRVECRLYRHYKDNENEYFVSAEKILSIRYDDPFYAGCTKEEIMGGFINAAKAGAESIALSKGGFGIQVETPEASDLYSDKNYEQNLKRIPVPAMPKKNDELAEKLKKTEPSPFIPYNPTKAEKKVSIPLPCVANEVDTIEETKVEIQEPTEVETEVHTKEETQLNETITLDEAKKFVTTSQNAKFKGKTLGEIFEESPLALPYIAVNTTDEREKEAATLLSNSSEESKAKLQQYLARG